MPVNLQASTDGIESAVLEEFRATHDELGEFFGDVFDQLHALSLELFARHKRTEALDERQRVFEEQQTELADELKRVRSLLESLVGRDR